MTHSTRLAAALVAAASVAAIPAASAKNPTDQVPAPTTDACGNPAGTSVFAQFHDRKLYLPAPDGGFEGGAADWTLDGATVVDGNETFGLAGDSGTKSLSLPAGGSATSPAICVAKGYPQFRFVARKDGEKRARLKVEVLYLSGRGGSRVAGKLKGGPDWRPTKKLAFALGRTRAADELTGQVAFRFTAVGNADWQVDDVFVDPHQRR